MKKKYFCDHKNGKVYLEFIDVQEFTTLDGNKKYFVEIKNKDTIDAVFAEGYKLLNNPIILKSKFEEIFGIEVTIEYKK